jgi:hypothetical protein
LICDRDYHENDNQIGPAGKRTKSPADTLYTSSLSQSSKHTKLYSVQRTHQVLFSPADAPSYIQSSGRTKLYSIQRTYQVIFSPADTPSYIQSSGRIKLYSVQRTYQQVLLCPADFERAYLYTHFTRHILNRKHVSQLVNSSPPPATASRHQVTSQREITVQSRPQLYVFSDRSILPIGARSWLSIFGLSRVMLRSLPISEWTLLFRKPRIQPLSARLSLHSGQSPRWNSRHHRSIRARLVTRNSIQTRNAKSISLFER